MTTKIPASMVEADVATQAELDAEATTGGSNTFDAGSVNILYE